MTNLQVRREACELPPGASSHAKFLVTSPRRRLFSFLREQAITPHATLDEMHALSEPRRGPTAPLLTQQYLGTGHMAARLG